MEEGEGTRQTLESIECTFSDAKHLFGDILRSRTQMAEVKENMANVLLLNEYKGIRMRCQRSRYIIKPST